MAIRTRLTERLGLRLPILNAPMGLHAGGRLAAAVTQAGGLGLIGGLGPTGIDTSGPWIEEQFAAAGNTRVGGGFITWQLAKKPELVAQMLAHAPAAVMLSFGDPAPYAPAIKQAGALLICQVQSLHHARAALDCGADIVIAQGGEAGGHGANQRSTLTLVPEVADFLARTSPDTLLLAAGGIGDGRGLAAALVLGADGVLMGSRLWASTESLAQQDLKQRALAAGGDDTIRTQALDILRVSGWPSEFSARILRNELTERWHGREDELRALGGSLVPAYQAALKARDFRQVLVNVGEVAGLMRSEEPAAAILERVAAEAERLLFARGWQRGQA